MAESEGNVPAIVKKPSEMVKKISAEHGHRSWGRRFSPTRGTFIKMEDEVIM